MPIVPKYREGFPRLDIVKGIAAIRRDKPICLFSSRSGIFRGYLNAEVDLKGRLVVEFELHAEYLQPQEGCLAFSLVRPPKQAKLDRHQVICPRCGEPFGTLFFTGRWACGGCHGLGYRSQYAGKEVLERERKLARRDKLKSRFAGGRPDGMWQATADKLQRELADLEAWLEREPMVLASKRHSPVISAEWMGVTEAERRGLILSLEKLRADRKADIPLVEAVPILREEY